MTQSGEELQGQDPGLAEVGHHTDRHYEQSGGVLEDLESSLLTLRAELEAEQGLELVRLDGSDAALAAGLVVGLT